MTADLTSTERGSGARFNHGKAPLQYLLWDVASDWVRDPVLQKAAVALGRFQVTRDPRALHELIDVLYPAHQTVLTAAAEVFAFGAKKYTAWDWVDGMPWSVPLACIGRHLLAEDKGETIDPESGLRHRAHAICNALMLLFYVKTYPEGDDLPPLELFKRSDAGVTAPDDSDEFVVVAGSRIPASMLAECLL